MLPVKSLASILLPRNSTICTHSSGPLPCSAKLERGEITAGAISPGSANEDTHLFSSQWGLFSRPQISLLCTLFNTELHIQSWLGNGSRRNVLINSIDAHCRVCCCFFFLGSFGQLWVLWLEVQLVITQLTWVETVCKSNQNVNKSTNVLHRPEHWIWRHVRSQTTKFFVECCLWSFLLDLYYSIYQSTC